jgi:D-beta-D-heptose 7-phosphate kinase/D-beta-D-heptose 1-phosphate adenosyltransferase
MSILVIGDAITDTYFTGTATRLSPEAPVPVVLNPEKTMYFGGAANVVENLRALGSKAHFIFDQYNTITKTRIVANGHILARIDEERYREAAKPIVNYDNYSYVVLSDYDKGMLHHRRDIIREAKKSKCKIFVDPKKPFEQYAGAYLLKANLAEFEAEIKKKWDAYDIEPCKSICHRYNIENLVITMGAEGVFLYESNPGPGCGGSRGGHIRAEQHNVVDVTGAGDVFLAALVHFQHNGLNLHDSCEMANIFAGISVTKFGTYTLTEEDIVGAWKPKEVVVFTNGCFDVLHSGHVHYLKESKKFGDKLVVGVNSDASVKRLKGPTRPINTAANRKSLLEQFNFVDEVIIFDEDTPLELIKKVRPTYITKASDYTPEEVVGKELATVIIIPKLEGFSSTRIINAK